MFEWLRTNLYIHTILHGILDSHNETRKLRVEVANIFHELNKIKLAIPKLEGPTAEPKTLVSHLGDVTILNKYKNEPSRLISEHEAQQMRQPSNDILLQQIKEMADDIRQMDQLIFNMSQCGSWDEMRPHFLNAEALMMQRKKNESSRITDIMRQELIKTYAPKLENMTPAERKHLGVDK